MIGDKVTLLYIILFIQYWQQLVFILTQMFLASHFYWQKKLLDILADYEL
jgi:hypothetical protein